MLIREIIVEQEGKDPKVMSAWLQNAAAVGSPGAKDPNVISKSISIYTAKAELSPDEAFSIAKGQLGYNKPGGGAQAQPKKKVPSDAIAQAQAQRQQARKDAKASNKGQAGWSDKTHGHLRGIGDAGSVGGMVDRLTDYIPGAKTVKKNFRKGKQVGNAIGSDLAKVMKGSGPRKTTF